MVNYRTRTPQKKKKKKKHTEVSENMHIVT